MVWVFLRHFHKAHGNGKLIAPHPFDAPLKSDKYSLGERMGCFLVKNWGVPKAIFCSPFLRTRQTAHRLCNGAKISVPIVIEPALGEHISTRWAVEYDMVPQPLSYETALYNPPVVEETGQVVERLTNFFSRFKDYKENLWFVTHGGNIEWWLKTMGYPHYPRQGEAIVYDPDNCPFPLLISDKLLPPLIKRSKKHKPTCIYKSEEIDSTETVNLDEQKKLTLD